MTREELKIIASETIRISSESEYSIGVKSICFHTEPFMSFYEKTVDLDKSKKQQNPAKIYVKNESTVDAIHRIQDSSLGVLNFASAKHPGGGFIVGSMAQEECLAYCSDLYIQQWPAGKAYYEKHTSQNNPFYTHTMFINNVTFFRDANFNLITNPKMCKVLTSAAVNMGVAIKQGKSKKEGNVIMKSRMRKILNIFVENNCKSIVLGAFGCGVFGNSAQDVARMWKELLIDEEYGYFFNEVCFSVLDTPRSDNYRVFETQFA